MRSAKFIWQARNWPDFTWKNISGEISAVREAWTRLTKMVREDGDAAAQALDMRMIETDAVRSAAIEGMKLLPENVRASVRKRLGMPFDDREIVPPAEGVVDMYLDAVAAHDSSLTANRLFAWNLGIFGDQESRFREITVGAWRLHDVNVISRCFDGRIVEFSGPPPKAVAGEMDRFLNWFNASDGTDGIVKAGVAHLWFVAVHPFDDGNGCMARVLVDMLLARAAGTRRRMCSFSSQLLNQRKE